MKNYNLKGSEHIWQCRLHWHTTFDIVHSFLLIVMAMKNSYVKFSYLKSQRVGTTMTKLSLYVIWLKIFVISTFPICLKKMQIEVGVLAVWNKKKDYVHTTCCTYCSPACMAECDYQSHTCWTCSTDLNAYVNPHRYVFQACATLTHSSSHSEDHP